MKASSRQAAPQAEVQVQRHNRVKTNGLPGQRRMSDTAPQGGMPTAPRQETETPRRWSVDPKCWSNHEKLELDMKPEGVVAWRDRALGYLAAERPDVRKLVLWADTQSLAVEKLRT